MDLSLVFTTIARTCKSGFFNAEREYILYIVLHSQSSGKNDLIDLLITIYITVVPTIC